MRSLRAVGFTLLEVLLSLSLLGLVTILVINIFPSSMATVRASEQRYRADTIARSLVEKQAALPFSALPVGLSQDFSPQTVDQINYTVHFDVSQSDSEDPTYLRALRATVKWTYRGQPRQVVSELWIHHLPAQQ